MAAGGKGREFRGRLPGRVSAHHAERETRNVIILALLLELDGQRIEPLEQVVHGQGMPGKGGKERLAPVLPVAREAVARYIAQCPHPLPPKESLFRGEKGGPLSPRIIQLRMQELRDSLGLPATATPHRRTLHQ